MWQCSDFLFCKTKEENKCLYYYSLPGCGSVVSSEFLRCVYFKFPESVKKTKMLSTVYITEGRGILNEKSFNDSEGTKQPSSNE